MQHTRTLLFVHFHLSRHHHPPFFISSSSHMRRTNFCFFFISYQVNWTSTKTLHVCDERDGDAKFPKRWFLYHFIAFCVCVKKKVPNNENTERNKKAISPIYKKEDSTYENIFVSWEIVWMRMICILHVHKSLFWFWQTINLIKFKMLEMRRREWFFYVRA